MQKGYYWVRSIGYQHDVIAEWDPALGESGLWHFMGVSATAQAHQIEVIGSVAPRSLARPISELPADETLALARTADGRTMVWRGSLLHSALRPSTPNHLQFPATQWIALTDIPW